MTNLNRKLVVFDFDYTLYDAEKWRSIAFLSLADLFGKEELAFKHIAQEAYDETRQLGYFDPVVFSETLVRKSPGHITPAEVLQAIYNPSLFNACYYPDTKQVLEKLSQQATLGLFSTNDSEYQQAKQADVIKYFDTNLVFIHKNKQEIIHQVTALTDRFEIFLVDDLISILQLAKEQKPEIRTVWIKQGPYAAKIEKLEEFAPDYAVSTLSGIIPIIGNSKH